MIRPRTSRHSVVATRLHDQAFAASIRTHRVFTDQITRAGGHDSAPTPLELLSASLASCIALHVTQFCERERLDADELAVEVIPIWRENPGRIARFDVLLHLPDTIPARYREALNEVVRSCPVYQTFAQRPDIVTREIQATDQSTVAA